MEITPIELEARLSQAKEMFAAAANGKPKQRLKALTEMRSILCSLETSELCEQFYNAVFLHIIVGTDRCYNAATRKKAAKCFQELVSKLLAFCEEKEEKLSLRVQVLDSVEARIFEFSGVNTHSSETALETARPALIAMNFLAQQCLKHMDVTLVNRFLNHGVAFLSDNRQVIRVLAIRLFRVFCKKLPSFMITQFQDYILESVFSAHAETESTGTIRRANQIFFDVLIGAFGYEIVCKYAKGQEGTLKLLKALEKKRRRRKVTSSSKKRKRTRSMVNDDLSSEEDDKMTTASRAQTIGADSIFKLLEESDEAPSDEDYEDAKSRTVQSMISIKEFRKALQRSETAEAQEVNKVEKLPKGLHIAEDGRLVIEDFETDSDEEESESDGENDY